MKIYILLIIGSVLLIFGQRSVLAQSMSVPVCNTPTLNSPADNLCVDPRSALPLSASLTDPANELEIVEDNTYSGFHTDNPYNWNAPDLTQGSHGWTAHASSSTNACTVSPFATPRHFTVDTLAPPIPGGHSLVCSLDPTDNTKFDVSYSWDAVSDNSCNNTVGYWAQASTDPAFGRVIDNWYNSWISGTTETTSSSIALPNGTTIYGHVRSRDGFDNQSGWSLTDSITCTAPTPTPTPTPTPVTPTPPIASWMKLKNASFHSYSSIINHIPASITAFDNDDDGGAPLNINPLTRVFNGGGKMAGLVSSLGTTQDYGTGKVSDNGFELEGYTKASRFTGSSFIDYIKSRKSYITITSLDQIEPNQINIYAPIVGPVNSLLTINDANKSSIENKLTLGAVVLIFAGPVVIDTNLNMSSIGITPASLAIIAAGPTGSISIKSKVSELGGIYIADKGIDFSYDALTSTTPLKIKGNITTTDPTPSEVSKRERDGNDKPSIFIDVIPELYVNLLPYLSTSVYEWNERTP